MSNSQTSVMIIGAGLAGSLLAVLMARKGYRVSMYERRPDMRVASISAGKSINLALSVRGIHALKEAGLSEDILDLAIPMNGRMIHDPQGELTYQSYSKDPENCIYSVSRGGLNKQMMSMAESMGNVDIHFQHRCKEVDFDTGKVSFHNEANGESITAEADIIVGSDGAFSSIRTEMSKMPRFDFSQSYLKHGYKELTIPAGAGGSFQIDKNALHIWPRGKYMLIALPNPDGSFTCTLFFPFEGPNSFESLDTDEKVLAFFQEQFPDAVPLMPTLLEDYHTNPTSALVTIRCYPWSVADKAVLVGDSAHAIVPFFGQGMNAAFEDCSVMSECVDAFAPDWGKVFSEYQERRKVNADAIAAMAIENFVEMRDDVGDPGFLLRKKVEHTLERTFPEYKSRYEMVSFSRIPYAEAYRLGEINDLILNSLTDGLEDAEQLNYDMADRMIGDLLRDD